MKNRSLALLATTLLSSIALTAHAAAPGEPEIHFHPAKAWVVGHAETATDCAVQSEFNNGFVLQFDGSNKWVQSFTVNFRQKIFNEGQNYDMTLTVPGKMSKKISTMATNSTMLTVPMQDQKELYNAIRDSSVVDIAVDENNFRFYLINFQPAAKKFEICMSGGDIELMKREPVKEAKTNMPQAASVEGNLAPPPPNGRNIDITANEAIAMEARETSGQAVPIVEILPDNPKATIQEIPYTETVKLGDGVVTKEEETKKPADVAAAAATATASPANAKGYKRMSEMLDEEMSKNPSAPKIDEISMASGASAMAIDSASAVTPPPAPPAANEKIIAEPIKEASAAPEPLPQGDEPFAGRGEIIKTDKKPEASVKAEPISPPPAAPAPAPVKQIQKLESPGIKVNKQSERMEADFTDLSKMEPASQDSNEPFRKADPEMLMKISDLEKKIHALEKENTALNDELKGSLEGSKQEKISIESENWNLERATMKFSEAERQVKKLGEQIQKERAQCMTEKKDLEAQLFDPQITDQQQLARLSSLEQKLADAERKLQNYEAQIRAMQSGRAPVTQ